MFRKWINEPEREEWQKDFDNNEVVSVREWMATMLLMVIPIVNIVMLFWWAFSNKELIPASKVNWARGTIIVLAALLFSATLVTSFFCLGMYMNSN